MSTDTQPRTDVPGWDDYFLGIAVAVAARAKCTRRRVGAVLTIDHRIIAPATPAPPPARTTA